MSKVDSISNNERLLLGIERLSDHLKGQEKSSVEHTIQLERLNESIKLAEKEKIVKMEQKLNEMKRGVKWVEDNPPAIDFNRGNILKKLDII